MTKICAMCKEEKELSQFRLRKRLYRKNEFYHHSYCFPCEKIRERNRYLKDKRGYETVRVRALNLLGGAKRRAEKRGDFDLDLNFIIEKLEKGRCEVTGLKFDFSCMGKGKKNPFAPSIDRIDNKLGYTKSNVRFVLWAVNLMHGEMTDDQLIKMCKAVIEGLEK